MTRKELKYCAKKNLKRHYILFVAVCLIAAFIGAEFGTSLSAFTSYSESGQTEGASKIIGLKKELTAVVDEMTNGTEQQTPSVQAPAESSAKNDSSVGKIFGTSRGVFATAINALSSGSFLVTIVTALNSVIHSGQVIVGILVSAAFLGMFALWFFFTNIFTAISRRIFLEGRLYDKLSPQRFLFFLRVKRWVKVSWTMFVMAVRYLLWSLTIVGAFIKRYSYFLVPYIVAENPDIKASDAILLSRTMMKGHKWECFVFELSFFWWNLLGILTLGITGIFYSNPYIIASFSEYYAQMRVIALETKLPGFELLNDRYLFEKPDEETIAAAYGDVLELIEKPKETMAELRGFRGFLAKNFGVLLTNSPEEQVYEESQAEELHIRVRKDAVEGKAYPERLFTIPETEKRQRVEVTHYLRHYSIWSLLLMFFILSFVGWAWEVSLHLVSDHQFVNRGMLHGPWLPIYGSGSLLILLLLNRLRAKPVLEFFSAIVLCGLVEYFTSYFTELAHNGQRWWDYSGYFLNLNGRICGEGLLVFGLGGMLVVYVLAPQMDNLIRKIPAKVVIPVSLILLGTYLVDQFYSNKHPNEGKGITAEKTACVSQSPRSEEPFVFDGFNLIVQIQPERETL